MGSKVHENEVGYEAKHKYIRIHLGRADHCELRHCGPKTPKRMQYVWANLDHKYSRNPEDYIQLCRSCHRRYDLGLIKIRGLTLKERGGEYGNSYPRNKQKEDDYGRYEARH